MLVHQRIQGAYQQQNDVTRLAAMFVGDELLANRRLQTLLLLWLDVRSLENISFVQFFVLKWSVRPQWGIRLWYDKTNELSREIFPLRWCVAHWRIMSHMVTFGKLFFSPLHPCIWRHIHHVAMSHVSSLHVPLTHGLCTYSVTFILSPDALRGPKATGFFLLSFEYLSGNWPVLLWCHRPTARGIKQCYGPSVRLSLACLCRKNNAFRAIGFFLARDVISCAYATMSVSVCLSVCLWRKCIGAL